MSTFRICPHGEPERSCPLCGLDEPRPEGLYQFLPASGRLFTAPTDPVANAIAAMRYIRERHPVWLQDRLDRTERYERWASGRMTMSDGIKASFNRAAEWCQDILRDRDKIEGELVRVTKRVRPMANTGLYRLELVATAVVAGRVIELVQLVGDLGWTSEKDAEVHDKADELMRPLEEQLAGAGLQVRAGMWEYV